MKSTPQAWIWLSISLLVLAFIFNNSLQTGENSTAASDLVADLFEASFAEAGLDKETCSFVIRKLAHFCEFVLLGLCFCFTACAFSMPMPWLSAVCAGVLCAGADEFLQRFIEGRSSQFADVMIDSAGVLFGFFLFLALSRLAQKWFRSAS